MMPIFELFSIGHRRANALNIMMQKFAKTKISWSNCAKFYIRQNIHKHKNAQEKYRVAILSKLAKKS